MRVHDVFTATTAAHSFGRRYGFAVALYLAASVAPLTCTAADPISLDRDTIFHFRSNSGPNNAGFTHLDGIQLGIWINPVPGTIVGATQVSSNGSIYQQSGTTTWGPFTLPYVNQPAIPTEFSTLYEYGPAAGSGLLGNWTIQVSNPGSPNSPQLFKTNSIAGVPVLPFVSDARVSYANGGITLGWTNPDTLASSIDIQIQDLSLPREYFGNSPSQYIGLAPEVHQESNRIPNQYNPLPGNTSSFVIPTTFSSGIALDPTHTYVASVDRDVFQTQEVDGVSKSYLVSRTKTFVNFTGAAPDGFTTPPTEFQIPTVTSNPDGSGTEFSFFIRELQPGRYFLDPAIAVGYEFRIGAGDPNFASLFLPNIGDGNYRVEIFDEALGKFVFFADVVAEQELLLGPGGVARFRVLGIETSAGLDPNDPTAFATGVTFAGGGSFTGKMIPISVPEPQTYALLVLGALVCAWRIRALRAKPH